MSSSFENIFSFCFLKKSAEWLPIFLQKRGCFIQPNLPKAPNMPAYNASFWHFRCKSNHNGLTFFGKSRATKEEAEQAEKRHLDRKHAGKATVVSNVEQTAVNHSKMLCQ
jgi:hypothetical protein